MKPEKVGRAGLFYLATWDLTLYTREVVEWPFIALLLENAAIFLHQGCRTCCSRSECRISQLFSHLALKLACRVQKWPWQLTRYLANIKKNEAATPARMLPLTSLVPFPPLPLKLLPSKGWVIVLVSLSLLCSRLEKFSTALKVLYMQSQKWVHMSWLKNIYEYKCMERYPFISSRSMSLLFFF